MVRLQPTAHGALKVGLALVLHGLAIHGSDAVPRSNDASKANLLQDQMRVLGCAHRSADVARSAAQVCGSLPIEVA